MINNYISAQLVSIILAIIFCTSILNECAFAYYDATHYEPDTTSQEYYYGLLAENAKYKSVRNYLRDNDLVELGVTDDELDYIILLSSQIASLYPSITPGLLLGTIAIESKFDSSADSPYGAKGLMQIVPGYHAARMMQFVDEGTNYTDELFYSPRQNIGTGCDYLSELMEVTEDDLAYALMIYNQGPYSAKKDYKGQGYISEYARTVIVMADQIDELINK